MSKIPLNPIVNTLKNHGPKMAKFVKENWKDIAETGKKVTEVTKKKQEESTNKEKLTYRERRYLEYKNETLTELDRKNRNELFQYKLEIESFIEQLNHKENEQSIFKKSSILKKINQWNDILIQITGRMAVKDYQEYLFIFNNPDYNSEYFTGYDGHLNGFKELIENKNWDELHHFISERTNKTIDDIKKDFS